MIGTRFVVLKMKNIICAGVFALIGILILIALITLITPKRKSEATSYIPGTYAAEIILQNKPITVYVTVDESEIQAIHLSDMDEAQALFYPLFKPTMESIAKEIIQKQTTNIATQPDNMYTGKVLIDAVNDALFKAIAKSEA